MSALQYKSVENIDIYVNIIPSQLQLIYILWMFLITILIMNSISFLKLFTRECMISKTDFNSSWGRISASHTSENFTCISFRNIYLFLFFFISTSLKLGIRMSNNKEKNYRYNYAPYSYNNINQTGKISSVEYYEIKIVGTRSA